MNVLVSGVGVVLPRAASAAELIEPGPADAPPVEPKDLVGKKGLRYKDRATQLAYCAARAALQDAALVDEEGLTVAAGSVAVVVSSNYGNLDTVTRAMDTITRETAAAGSPMDLPNASSNVVASSVAIRFGLRGPNLMLCNGATSGLDALRWGAGLIRAGRVSRALALGVEPDNAAVRAFTGADRLLDGAVGVVLESEESAAGRGVPGLAVLGAEVRGAGLAASLARLAGPAGERPALWQVPETDAGADALPADLLDGVPRDDLGERFGTASGALGVLQCAAAVGWFARGGAGPVVASAGTDADDASAGLVLLRPAAV
ncbi:beta-ketoacyl synthase N-terminal-like domain-containing protein [Kitasatospora sp. CM 4170]|uniref:Beta-ketoacyl synthase N-terminal-like domain-containing protein n=1 Tax=Kitasatospora aburaviensis TaxID=67265 RepID=A0ABW1ESY0_9ACTN|nr:beta-ketoacyl synthase N-terminal-like domain-containing protein [Kitasatospora sp. CM 4170]WNM44802.1 beta-ketoacyl synthase N-terminal-like domain-containing protein [Kitasatospora sp. CM 4170]